MKRPQETRSDVAPDLGSDDAPGLQVQAFTGVRPEPAAQT